MEKGNINGGVDDSSQGCTPMQPCQVRASKDISKATLGKTRRKGKYSFPACQKTGDELGISRIQSVSNVFSLLNDGLDVSTLRAFLNLRRQTCEE